MALDPSQRVSRAASLPDGLELSPQDYFVLSRVEGSLSVGDLVLGSGLPPDTARPIVERLVEAGALRVVAETGGHPRVASSPSRSRKLRERAEDRRRNALVTALRTKDTGSQRSVPLAEITRDTAPSGSGQEPEEAEDEAADEALEYITRAVVDADDPRLDGALALELSDQRWILALADGHAEVSQFDILGIQPTHDVRAIKRAYHETSRELHPDAYYGRDVGPFREILSTLFREAKRAYGELRREDVRAPWVDRRIEDDARARREEAAIEEGLRVQREAEAAARRVARSEARAASQRDRMRSEMKNSSRELIAEAEAAEAAGNKARASNLYRLAMRADPTNTEVVARWEAVRGDARKKRGGEAFQRAMSYLDLGQPGEARPLLVEAAEADPTAEHLAHAAFAVRNQDAGLARNLAMAGLDAIRVVSQSATQPRPGFLCSLHVKIGHAFLAVGQRSSATEQANAAIALRTDDPDARALLKACKAK